MQRTSSSIVSASSTCCCARCASSSVALMRAHDSAFEACNCVSQTTYLGELLLERGDARRLVRRNACVDRRRDAEVRAPHVLELGRLGCICVLFALVRLAHEVLELRQTRIQVVLHNELLEIALRQKGDVRVSLP